MADWFTPVQRQKALETTWTTIENTDDCTPYKEIKEEDLVNYYSTSKQHTVPRLQYDLYFNTDDKSFDPNIMKDGVRNQKEIHNNIYTEEIQRPVPLVTSHIYGHLPKNDLEGRILNGHRRVEYKADFRRSGLPLDPNAGLPRNNTNDLFFK